MEMCRNDVTIRLCMRFKMAMFLLDKQYLVSKSVSCPYLVIKLHSKYTKLTISKNIVNESIQQSVYYIQQVGIDGTYFYYPIVYLGHRE